MGLITVKDLCWRTVIARLSHALQCFVEKQSTSKLACNKDYTVLSPSTEKGIRRDWVNHYKDKVLSFLRNVFLYFILFQEHSMLMISFSPCACTVLTDAVLFRACSIRGGTMLLESVFREPWMNEK